MIATAAIFLLGSPWIVSMASGSFIPPIFHSVEVLKMKQAFERDLQEGNTSSPMETPAPSPGKPTLKPTASPTESPAPSPSPSKAPTLHPSSTPTVIPSTPPTPNPSPSPSEQPVGKPSTSPTELPSARPTNMPSASPSSRPSGFPSAFPSSMPSASPSSRPSGFPSAFPSSFPTLSQSPTSVPTGKPSQYPSSFPSGFPSNFPSSDPTHSPSTIPSFGPTSVPSLSPSFVMADQTHLFLLLLKLAKPLTEGAQTESFETGVAKYIADYQPVNVTGSVSNVSVKVIKQTITKRNRRLQDLSQSDQVVSIIFYLTLDYTGYGDGSFEISSQYGPVFENVDITLIQYLFDALETKLEESGGGENVFGDLLKNPSTNSVLAAGGDGVTTEDERVSPSVKAGVLIGACVAVGMAILASAHAIRQYGKNDLTRQNSFVEDSRIRQVQSAETDDMPYGEKSYTARERIIRIGEASYIVDVSVASVPEAPPREQLDSIFVRQAPLRENDDTQGRNARSREGSMVQGSPKREEQTNDPETFQSSVVRPTCPPSNPGTGGHQESTRPRRVDQQESYRLGITRLDSSDPRVVQLESSEHMQIQHTSLSPFKNGTQNPSLKRPVESMSRNGRTRSPSPKRSAQSSTPLRNWLSPNNSPTRRPNEKSETIRYPPWLGRVHTPPKQRRNDPPSFSTVNRDTAQGEYMGGQHSASSKVTPIGGKRVSESIADRVAQFDKKSDVGVSHKQDQIETTLGATGVLSTDTDNSGISAQAKTLFTSMVEKGASVLRQAEAQARNTSLQMLNENREAPVKTETAQAGTYFYANTEVYDVLAPSGPIGIVVDTTKEGPCVHSLKPNSPMIGLITPGDLIIGLDDQDTRDMTAATLTRMMAQKSSQPGRKITLLSVQP